MYSYPCSAVAEEVELLSHVYLEDMTVMRSDGYVPCSSSKLSLIILSISPPSLPPSLPLLREFALQFHITPSTADDKDRQFVYLDLSILLTKGVSTIIMHFCFEF